MCVSLSLPVCLNLFFLSCVCNGNTPTQGVCVCVCVCSPLFVLTHSISLYCMCVCVCVCVEDGDQVIGTETPLAFNCVCLSLTHPCTWLIAAALTVLSPHCCSGWVTDSGFDRERRGSEPDSWLLGCGHRKM